MKAAALAAGLAATVPVIAVEHLLEDGRLRPSSDVSTQLNLMFGKERMNVQTMAGFSKTYACKEQHLIA